jgi:hypothetical protein
MPKDIKLSLRVSCEGVYRVFYGEHEICNTLDKDEAEYLFQLAKEGYDFYNSFGKERIE